MCIRDRDKIRKDAVDTRNDADSMVFQTEKAMEEVGDKLDAADKAEVQTVLDELKKMIEATPVSYTHLFLPVSHWPW